jgi:hypothetical protein
VRRPGQLKVDDTGKLKATLEKVDNGIESLVLNIVMADIQTVHHAPGDTAKHNGLRDEYISLQTSSSQLQYLSDIFGIPNGTSLQYIHILTIAFPELLNSLEILLTSNNPNEIINASYKLIETLPTHLNHIISFSPSALVTYTPPLRGIFTLLSSHWLLSPTTMGDIIISLISQLLHLMTPLAGEYKDILARGVLVIYSATTRDSPLRQALMYCLIREYAQSEDEEMKWCLYYMLEEGIKSTGWVCHSVGMELERLSESGDTLIRKLWERISRLGGEEVGAGI